MVSIQVRTCTACGNSTAGEQPCRVCAHDPRVIEFRTPDQLDRFAAGEISPAQVVCVLCSGGPTGGGCVCPRFGSAAYFVLVAVRHGKPYVGPAVSCRHCGQEIELINGGRTWRHLSTDTATGTRHMTCGFGGELGTAATPTDD